MSTIKRRIQALEKKSGGSDPLIVFVRSFSDNAERFAVFLEGPNRGLRVEREVDEPAGAFLNRVETMKRSRGR